MMESLHRDCRTWDCPEETIQQNTYSLQMQRLDEQQK